MACIRGAAENGVECLSYPVPSDERGIYLTWNLNTHEAAGSDVLTAEPASLQNEFTPSPVRRRLSDADCRWPTRAPLIQHLSL